MFYGFFCAIVGVALVIGLRRSRPAQAAVTWTDWYFLGFTYFALCCCAGGIQFVVMKSGEFPAMTSVAIVIGSTLIGCGPIVVAQYIYRRRIGIWWPNTTSTNVKE